MNIAFYAPLKPPDHPIPSGDRLMGQMLVRGLELAGFGVTLVSRFRSYDRAGNAAYQRRIRLLGNRLADRLCRRIAAQPEELRPQLFLSYHVYYKSPDWIGPRVCDRFGIPYVLVEASYARKQADGPWALNFDSVQQCIARADRIFNPDPADEPALRERLGSRAHILRSLPPFLDTERWRPPLGVKPVSVTAPVTKLWERPCRLVTVAMMRPGDKLASYRLLAQALRSLRDLPWTLDIVGDGAARREVEIAMATFGEQRVRWHGRLATPQIARLLHESDLYVWPAVNEGCPMSLIEASAAGLPVLAGYRTGVAALVQDGVSGLLCEYLSVSAFAAGLRRLLSDASVCRRMGAAGFERAQRIHSLESTAKLLASYVHELMNAPPYAEEFPGKSRP